MIIQILNQLWQKKKRSLGKRLQKGIGDLAYILQPVAEENKYSQQMIDNEIHWLNQDGNVEIMFFYVADPRNFELVTNTFRRTRETQCEFSCIFVHQWADGDGNWDVFGLHPQRGLVHWNRFWGNRWLVNDPGPFLNEKIYNLFTCGQDFPLISRRRWVKLLLDSVDKTRDQLEILAGKHRYSQDKVNGLIRWQNSDKQTEVLFYINQNFPSLDDYIRIYDQINIEKCPITYLFQRAHPEVFDIFKFSARSYMEHHNQLKK